MRGETVVITGTLAGMTRDEARDAARAAGATVTDSVSKKTTLLVVGAEAGSKLRKAQELGVRIVDETEFQKLLSGARYSTHFATVWRNLLLPEGNSNFQVRFAVRDEASGALGA